MIKSVRKELLSHILDKINDGCITNDNIEDWHHICFNEDYYIIGYYQASEWLKSHDLDAFEVIADVIDWEYNYLGEVTLKAVDINSEKIVNLYVYIEGEKLFYDLDCENINKLKNIIASELK